VTEAPGDKPIRLSQHASGYLDRRGFTRTEVEETINAGQRSLAKQDRLEAMKDFAYDSDWNGRRYATKRVRAVFVEEDTEIVVVTVYTYYF
jgi:hypothetical protein